MAYPTPASSFPQTHSEIEMEMEIQCSSPARTIDASSASSSTPVITSRSRSCDYGYDVFISYQGPDTKKTFASYLYRRLIVHGFRPFLDQQELQEGLDFPSQIAGVIRTASVHVAIFSKNYAKSQWCLEELLLMRESGAPVIPVFYHVKPSSLRHGEALNDLERKTKRTDKTQPRYDPDTIKKWRNALSSFADVSGFELDGNFNGNESHMLDEVVQRVVKILAINTRLYVAKYPTGLDNKVKDFETVLRQQHTGKVQILGIFGLGGVGKTTLAIEFFNRKRSDYSGSHFLPDVRENSKTPLHLLQLQRDFLKRLTRSYDDDVDHDINIIHQKLKMFLSSSRVLLILDDVDHEDQVDTLLPDRDAYCSDSLILITTRDRDVLRRSGVEDTSIYKLTGLARESSRELFCSYAFSQAYPLQGFEDLVDQFLKVCQGLPLSLKVLGALLLGKNDDKSFWEDTLSQVHQVPHEIQKRLKISYDALHEKEQQIFLDIACFFIGEKRNTTVVIWDEPGCKGWSRFHNLQNKSLVEVDSHNYIHMHDHLRDMGRGIAHDKLPRRLWHPKDNIDDFLLQSSVITQVRGIRTFGHDETLSWYQRKSRALFGNWGMRLHNRLHNTRYHSPGIAAMKLQLLQTEGHLLERILRRVHSPDLVWLSWRDCPYSNLPSWIPVNNLRVLKVEGKVLETLWQDRSQVPFQLRVLEISGKVSKISKSVGQLKHLERFFFRYGSFQKLPKEFCNMQLLKVLALEECSKLKALPDSFGNLTNLEDMELSGCSSLEKLPESLGNLTNLQSMQLSRLESLERLPESLGNLTNLQSMQLSGLESLERLPESLGNLMNLQSMDLDGLGSLKWLSESLGNLTNLQSMKLYRLVSLVRLPESLGNLTNLQSMELHDCGNLERLPESLGALTNLQSMKLYRLVSLERLPESLGNLTNLQSMELHDCGNLERLPESLGNLTNLQSMELHDCVNLERLPESLGNLTNLQSMKLYRLVSLERLPESLGNLTNLQSMVLHDCRNLERLPESLGNLTNLQSLQFSLCGSVERLPSIKTLLSLEELRASHCVKLKSIPDLAQLTKLRLLNVKGCLALEELDGVEHCKSLVELNAVECPNLKWGDGAVNKLGQQNTEVELKRNRNRRFSICN